MDSKKIKSISIVTLIFFMGLIGIIIFSNNKKKDSEGTSVGDGVNVDVSNMSYDEAVESMEKMYSKVSPSTAELIKSPVDLSGASLANEVPPITEYPCSVTGNGQVDIEIFATSEKSGSGNDGWINDVAKDFNSKKFTTADGKTMSVSIRPMASGLGADYIISKVYEPTAYTPSNELFGAIAAAGGADIKMVTDVTVKNVAGVLVSENIYNTIKSKYDDVNVNTIIRATEENVIAMGYTNPLSSATGLNFLINTLYINDQNNILSDKAVEGFRNFQNNVPYVAYTTLQMRESAKSGSLNGMVMEYQTYINDSELKDNYQFIPFGILHNNPMYAVGNLPADKEETLNKFVEFCKADEAQNLAKKYGFGQFEYTPEVDLSKFTNRDIADAQKLWKDNKDLNKDIVAVFVADTSGSMSGEPINQLKQSLINGSKYIGDNVQVGMVSYNSSVTVNLPIAKFDLNQRAYFQGAVESLYANGGTASYDAVMVGSKMLIDVKKANPNAKVMLFLLSDGQANEGLELKEIADVMSALDIPIYTIAYGDEADKEELKALSSVNEAAAIDANSDDVIYKIKNLFNSEM